MKLSINKTLFISILYFEVISLFIDMGKSNNVVSLAYYYLDILIQHKNYLKYTFFNERISDLGQTIVYYIQFLLSLRIVYAKCIQSTCSTLYIHY